MDSIDRILTARLVQFLNPWRLLGIDRLPVEPYRPVENFSEVEHRDLAYHYGRIRYFMERLRSGAELDPIVLDCETGRYCVYPIPVMIDGCHRFAAALEAGAHKIDVSFSGRRDLLEYLMGFSQEAPE